MEDKTSSMGPTARQHKQLFEEYKKLYDILANPSTTQEHKDGIMGTMQATLAAYGIRITGTSMASDSNDGPCLAITYEYKWVPTDGSKAIPRWDTGVVTTYGVRYCDIFEAYVIIFRIVLEARDALRAMPKQSVDL